MSAISAANSPSVGGHGEKSSRTSLCSLCVHAALPSSRTDQAFHPRRLGLRGCGFPIALQTVQDPWFQECA
jgi:hypothetical protein